MSFDTITKNLLTTNDPNEVIQNQPKEAVKHRNTYFIYCPKLHIEKIRQTAVNLPFNCIFNDFQLNNFNGKTILFYGMEELSASQKDFLLHAASNGARVEQLTAFLDKQLGYTEVSLLSTQYFINEEAIEMLWCKKSQFLKSFIDKLIALLLLAFTFPIIVLATFAIRLESKGPILYRQLRVGQYNREYNVYKFRSMRTDAEKNGPQWAEANDNRITRVGRFIRATRIDELPQLFNVLNGDMSMVGPRPEREVFIKDLEQHIPYYRFRHAIKPGITGHAQVCYQYGSSVDDAIWKHKYDVHYIKHQSLWFDIKIMLKTIPTVLFGMGR
ncbi:exopolysaccharide biosynthesis polyprenyl glycosylphosphotransferase [Pseudoalteromonas piratica]|uniref:Exopolysaccharide biosynthesis protein n=1 Tax=Pseudoalteromonas piratica TaxID=1348114 RepID=A0A0A7ELJ5_9GAMM|nr:exopolysaccharide biosynthesis polyprenyl glycosylphosphotransferase [Pseudoalteromonas piratica]AIY66941.1 exopolysaccharide biosynthesis protein [Pseudoalteromonas piratica]